MEIWYALYEIDVGVQGSRDSKPTVNVTAFSGQLLNLANARHREMKRQVALLDLRTCKVYWFKCYQEFSSKASIWVTIKIRDFKPPQRVRFNGQ